MVIPDFSETLIGDKSFDFVVEADMKEPALVMCITLFWLGFFMYVKWLGRSKITPLSKIFKKDAIKLKFTP